MLLTIRIIGCFAASLINFLLALFIWNKGWQKKINLYIGLTAFFSSVYGFSIVFVLWQKTIFWEEFSWCGALIVPSYIGFTSYLRQKPHPKIIFWFFVFGTVFTLLGYTPLITKGIELYPHYLPIYGPLEPIARLYVLSGGIYGFYSLVAAYRASGRLKRLQVKYLLIGSSIYTFGAVLTAAIIPLLKIGTYYVDDTAIYFSVFWMGLTVYSIIRYRLMEIETVIHRTILWALTSVAIFTPLGILLYFIYPWFIHLNRIQLIMVIALLVYFYVYLHPKIQLQIDHLFRRRKYDYQTILGKVAEKIATTIDIEELTQNLLTEVCEAMYLRNSQFYVLSKDEMKYSLIGKRGYKEVNGVRQRTELEVYSEEERGKLSVSEREFSSDSPLSKWLTGQTEILEREQVEINPQYEVIKNEALPWFKDQEIELIVPLVYENKVNGIMGLGRKENLQVYTIEDIKLLKKLGEEAGVTVFNSLHHEDLVEKERLDEELKMGRQIQTALLPQELPQVPALTVQGLMLPAKEIGGDYYDFITLPDKDSLAVVIGDVSGKGVGAGLIMSLTKATIHTLSQEGFSPKEILLRTNRFLNKHIGGEKFMTLLYLLWQAQNKTITYSSAGHEHILVYRAQGPATTGRTTAGNVEAIISGGFMLGMLPDIDRFLEEKQLHLNPGDKILLYTDGVTEAEDASGGRFGLERLKEALARHGSKPADELMQAVKEEVYTFIGAHPQYDDITLVVLEAK